MNFPLSLVVLFLVTLGVGPGRAADRGILLGAGQAAVVDGGVEAVIGEQRGERSQRCAKRGEHDDLLAAGLVASEQLEQCRGLGRARNARRQSGQVLPTQLGEALGTCPGARAGKLLDAAQRQDAWRCRLPRLVTHPP